MLEACLGKTHLVDVQVQISRFFNRGLKHHSRWMFFARFLNHQQTCCVVYLASHKGIKGTLILSILCTTAAPFMIPSYVFLRAYQPFTIFRKGFLWLSFREFLTNTFLHVLIPIGHRHFCCITEPHKMIDGSYFLGSLVCLVTHHEDRATHLPPKEIDLKNP